MNELKDEQRFLEHYARHAFEDNKDNLDRIKTRLGMKSPSQKYMQLLFRRSRICYGLSCLLLFLGLGIYGSYHWMLGATHGQHHIAVEIHPDILNNLQSGRMLTIVYVFLVILLLLAIGLLGLAVFFRNKAKNLKTVQQNDTPS